METGLDRFTPLEMALRGAGFEVDKVARQGKRTVITVVRYRQSGANPCFSLFKTPPPGLSPEEQAPCRQGTAGKA